MKDVGNGSNRAVGSIVVVVVRIAIAIVIVIVIAITAIIGIVISCIIIIIVGIVGIVGKNDTTIAPQVSRNGIPLIAIVVCLFLECSAGEGLVYRGMRTLPSFPQSKNGKQPILL